VRSGTECFLRSESLGRQVQMRAAAVETPGEGATNNAVIVNDAG